MIRDVLKRTLSPATLSIAKGTIVTPGVPVVASKLNNSTSQTATTITTGLGTYSGTGNVDFGLLALSDTFISAAGGNVKASVATSARASVCKTACKPFQIPGVNSVQ